MLDGSNALYKEELKNLEGPKANADLFKKAADLGSGITGAVLEIVGDSELAKTMLSGSTELVKLTCDFGENIANGVDVTGVTDFLNGLPGIIGSMVSALGGDFKAIGEMVASAGTIGTGTIELIAVSIKARKPFASLLIGLVSDVVSFGVG